MTSYAETVHDEIYAAQLGDTRLLDGQVWTRDETGLTRTPRWRTEGWARSLSNVGMYEASING